MKKEIYAAVMVLAMGAAVLVSSCQSNTNETKTESGAGQTTKAGESKAKETAPEAATAELNYAITNFLDEEYDSVISAFGEPASDSQGAEDLRDLTYDDPARVLHLGKNGDGKDALYIVSAKAGDLFTLSQNEMKEEEFLKAVDGEKLDSISEKAAQFLTVGDQKSQELAFSASGYVFVISTDEKGTVAKDNAALVMTVDALGEADGAAN